MRTCLARGRAFRRCINVINRHASSGRAATSDEARSTLNAREADHFRRLAAAWRESHGPYSALEAMNTLRVPLIREALRPLSTYPGYDAALPLLNTRILDVGCGGGLLSEPLARIGATVVGIDAVAENIDYAAAHAKRDPEVVDNVTYFRSTIEEYIADHPDERFDAVVASEVIEHVDNQPLFVKLCTSVLRRPTSASDAKPSSLFFTSMNRNFASYLSVIVAAEYLLGIVPLGTHDWNKFVSPDELTTMLADNGCVVVKRHGMTYNPITCEWSWSSITPVHYAIQARAVAQ